MSQYVTFADNPIFYSDEFGDTVRIENVKYKNNVIEASYVNDQWIVTGTKEVIDLTKVEGGKRDIMEGYDAVSKNENLKDYMKLINESTTTVKLELGWSSDENMANFNDYFNMKSEKKSMTVTVSTHIPVSDARSVYGSLTYDRNAIIAHEMGHVYDAMFIGSKNFRRVPGQNFNLTEINAIYFENLYRVSQPKGGLRRSYGATDDIYNKYIIPNKESNKIRFNSILNFKGIPSYKDVDFEYRNKKNKK